MQEMNLQTKKWDLEKQKLLKRKQMFVKYFELIYCRLLKQQEEILQDYNRLKSETKIYQANYDALRNRLLNGTPSSPPPSQSDTMSPMLLKIRTSPEQSLSERTVSQTNGGSLLQKRSVSPTPSERSVKRKLEFLETVLENNFDEKKEADDEPEEIIDGEETDYEELSQLRQQEMHQHSHSVEKSSVDYGTSQSSTQKKSIERTNLTL
jgi:hypothetical protein